MNGMDGEWSQNIFSQTSEAKRIFAGLFASYTEWKLMKVEVTEP